VDVGSGDARLPLRLARAEPVRGFVALDPVEEGLAAAAWRAGRPARRGGVANLLCVAEPVERAADALEGVADRVSVLLPWGRLLRGAAGEAPEVLAAVGRLGRPGCAYEIVLSYDARDARAAAPLGERALDATRVESLRAAYAAAGLRLGLLEPLGRDALRALPTTWARRLAYGAPRAAWRLRARRTPT
jgi:hypothetical protein